MYPAYFSYPAPLDWDTGSDLGYDNMTNTIVSILTVKFTVANMERTQCCNRPEVDLQCIRATDFSEGSRVAPALPQGTPWPKPGVLSTGAKGGIAAGVIVLALSTAGILLYFRGAKRKKRARTATEAAQADRKTNNVDNLPPEADTDSGVHELTSKDRKQELDSLMVSELGSSNSSPAELANTQRLVELPADHYRGEH